MPAVLFSCFVPAEGEGQNMEVHMKQTKNEKILYRVKGNKFLFVVKNIWNVFWYAIGILLSIGFGTILLSGLSGIFRNDGQMNPVILNFGLLMIPLLILIRIIHIIFLRKNQFYIITEHGITSEGGFLTRFKQTLHMDEIQSVSYTRTLIQQIFGCGDIVISSAAASRGTMVLKNINQVKRITDLLISNSRHSR